MLETYFGLKFWEEIIGWVIVGIIVITSVFAYAASTLIEFIIEGRKHRQQRIAEKKEERDGQATGNMR